MAHGGVRSFGQERALVDELVHLLDVTGIGGPRCDLFSPCRGIFVLSHGALHVLAFRLQLRSRQVHSLGAWRVQECGWSQIGQVVILDTIDFCVNLEAFEECARQRVSAVLALGINAVDRGLVWLDSEVSVRVRGEVRCSLAWDLRNGHIRVLVVLGIFVLF